MLPSFRPGSVNTQNTYGLRDPLVETQYQEFINRTKKNNQSSQNSLAHSIQRPQSIDGRMKIVENRVKDKLSFQKHNSTSSDFFSSKSNISNKKKYEFSTFDGPTIPKTYENNGVVRYITTMGNKFKIEATSPQATLNPFLDKEEQSLKQYSSVKSIKRPLKEEQQSSEQKNGKVSPIQSSKNKAREKKKLEGSVSSAYFTNFEKESKTSFEPAYQNKPQSTIYPQHQYSQTIDASVPSSQSTFTQKFIVRRPSKNNDNISHTIEYVYRSKKGQPCTDSIHINSKNSTAESETAIVSNYKKSDKKKTQHTDGVGGAMSMTQYDIPSSSSSSRFPLTNEPPKQQPSDINEKLKGLGKRYEQVKKKAAEQAQLSTSLKYASEQPKSNLLNDTKSELAQQIQKKEQQASTVQQQHKEIVLELPTQSVNVNGQIQSYPVFKAIKPQVIFEKTGNQTNNTLTKEEESQPKSEEQNRGNNESPALSKRPAKKMIIKTANKSALSKTSKFSDPSVKSILKNSIKFNSSPSKKKKKGDSKTDTSTSEFIEGTEVSRPVGGLNRTVELKRVRFNLANV